MCTGAESAEKAVELYTKTKELFRRCSMNLRSWATNDETVRAAFASEDRENSPSLSVLGMNWDQFADTLNVRKFSPTTEMTLHGVVSATASFYDVCGLFAPLQICAKMLIQSVQLAKKKKVGSAHEKNENVRSALKGKLARTYDEDAVPGVVFNPSRFSARTSA